ncbi:MAG: NAD(P)H-binding protein [Candidatus Thiodiazotropha sp.]
MRILITGATGFIGSHIATALTETEHQLVLCARDTKQVKRRFPDADAIQVDFTRDFDTALWLQRVQDIDIVINTVGIIREHGSQSFNALHRDTPIALFRACEIVGVKRVIQISALGADDSAISHYHLSKRAADRQLSSLQLEWAILMPSIVYGPNAKSMALFKALSSFPLIPLVDAGEQQIQPLHIDDLVAAVLQCIETDQPMQKRIELVGPEPITMRALHSNLRHWLGYPPARFISLPYSVALRFAKWAGLLGCAPIDDGAMRMLQRGNTGDVTAYVEVFGHFPKHFIQALTELPAQQSDRWHAGLYFLRPMLRWSIAFVWLFTAIVSLFLVPTEVSYGMLTKTGISEAWAPLFLYGASSIDLFIGLAVLFRFYPSQIGWLQILLIIVYTLIISFTQPEHWLHPFGPVSKNAPLIISILILLVLEKKS